jgi:ATP-dependent RNA helicase DeaD
MNASLFDSNLSEDLARTITRKGYETLTPIQSAVLELDAANVDLRITSVTGSGKTLAIGFALRDIDGPSDGALPKSKGPRAIIIVPTRELARQVQTELTWLFRERHWRIESLTGGTSIRDERRALSAFPKILVATPGRLLDHLRHGAIDTQQVMAVVLDEADRMLDMGFQEDLQAILDTMPEQRRTHMASATFCDEVGRLANRYQRKAVHVRVATQGDVNQDIEHVVHLVSPGQHLDALVNLLLGTEGEQAIVFARMRADVNVVARELDLAGFPVVSLSGEMAQPARDRALAVFRRGEARVLVATDVAARGLDIQGVTHIIHMEPPTDPESYVHRSGRTGRAGNKGTSHSLVVPPRLGFVKMLMRRAGVKFSVLPIPTAESLMASRDQSLFLELIGSDTQEPERQGESRHRALAARLCDEANIVDVVSRLLMRVEGKEIAPRQVRSPREPQPFDGAQRRVSFNKTKPNDSGNKRKPAQFAKANNQGQTLNRKQRRQLAFAQQAC